jgi:hypothetical protein
MPPTSIDSPAKRLLSRMRAELEGHNLSEQIPPAVRHVRRFDPRRRA